MVAAAGPSITTLGDIIGAVAESSSVSYVIDANYRLRYCNPAWKRFAAENRAPELAEDAVLGTDLRRVMGKDLRLSYMRAFAKTRQDGLVWRGLYECSTPVVFRKFQMRIHPLEPSGWLITNTLVVERSHANPVIEGLDNYRNSDSQITMCSHCRNSRRSDFPDQWDFVPAHLQMMVGRVSHGLCPVCHDYFYPKLSYDSVVALRGQDAR